jgi:hypothetical protein
VAYSGEAGEAGAAPGPLQPIGAALWQGLRSSTGPRLVAAAALNRLADGLARSGETLRVLAAPLAGRDQAETVQHDRGADLTRDVPELGQQDRGAALMHQVPEPSSLACVLAALAAAWWGSRRR